ncbi:aminodeoxychorismate/anthranilate synthase component II [Kitasatospora sp. NPDC058406]|uniref:aminodeoxychorismate/anthranilate synthase component II n=1 Tax=Kitasatospora sp. NPDC058406 TaxID=3346483 RepID=UPI00365B6B86
MTRTAQRLLRLITGPTPPPFALVHRPATTGPGILDVLTGTVSRPARIGDLPVPDADASGRHQVLALLPHRLPAGPGGTASDDGDALTALRVTEQALAPVAEVLGLLPGTPVGLTGAGAEPDDEDPAPLRRTDAGRSFSVTVTDWSPSTALALFRRLLGQQPGAYWTFVLHTGDRVLLGASPRRHVGLDRGTIALNPAGGTYRYPPGGPTTEGVVAFLTGAEEAARLYRAVDEGLGTAGRLCAAGGRIAGPRLRTMPHLAHTEYQVEGRTTRDVRTILHETRPPAPAVRTFPDDAGGPSGPDGLGGPGHHPGVIALIGRDGRGRQALDSAVLARTAEVDATGRLRIRVDPAPVRGSAPAAATAWTRIEAADLLSALRTVAPAPGTRAPEPSDLGSQTAVRRALAARHEPVAAFWQAEPEERAQPMPALEGRRVLVLDPGDTFTALGRQMLTALGATVEVSRFGDPHGSDAHPRHSFRPDGPRLPGPGLPGHGPEGLGPQEHGPQEHGPQEHAAGRHHPERHLPDGFGLPGSGFDGYDLVMIGPGPGDPRQSSNPGIAHLRGAVAMLLSNGTPFLAVGLGHQVLCTLLGLAVVRRPAPQRGVRRTIDLFGRTRTVGFHNTFAARCDNEDFPSIWRPGTVLVSRDDVDGEVHALRGPDFASVQFHPASVLTRNGPALLGGLLADLLTAPVGTS